jgi:hypothetical protein
MIVREYVACDTCQQQYMLRIQVGVREVQKHRFHCVSCKESIELTLKLEGEARLGITLDANCTSIAQSGDALPYYLSPDFVAGSDEIHNPMAFPALDFMHDFMKKLRPEDLEQPPDMEKARNHPIWHLDSIWPKLQKAWRLADSGRYDLSNALVKEFCDEHEISPPSLPAAQYFFLGAIHPLQAELQDEVVEIAEQNEAEFKNFVHYYQVSIKAEHRKDFYALLSDFFTAFSDFNQVFLYARNDQSMPEGARATSVNFDSVKKFYASCYEFYAGAIHLFTCLNNIKEGRKFDQLSKISLAKYLETDKAERRKSLANAPVFYAATGEFDSRIRNASFHNWFRLKDNKQDIEYRSGGTGAVREIGYADYLNQCVKMFLQICQLFLLELVFDLFANKFALVTKLPN